MKLLVVAPFLTLSVIPLVTQAYAEVSVNVQNSVNSSSSNVSTSNNKTTIRIETNGEVKEFTAEGNESINWTSEDGQSSVKVNQETQTGDNMTNRNDTNDSDEKNTQAFTPTPQEQTKNEKDETPKPSLLTIIITFFTSLFT